MKKAVAIVLSLLMMLTLVLTVSADYETWTDDETDISYLQVFNCDTNPNGTNSYTVDKEDAQEGQGCLVLQVGDGKVNEMLPAEPIDGTDYDTLEFDMYVSDLAIFDLFYGAGKNSGFEITSSGTCDYQEISWILADIRDYNQGGEWVEGWNHVVLPFNTATIREAGTTAGKEHLTGQLDPSNINYFRFFMVNDNAGDIVIKLDNICLSDRQAIEEEIRQQEEWKKAADKFVKKIEETDEITAENYETLKLKVISCRSVYDKLSDEAKKLVPASALAKLERCEKAIADFEANPPTDDPVDEPTDDPVDDPVDEPTDEPTTEEQPKDEQPSTDEPAKSGCGAAISLSAVVVLVLSMAFGVAAVEKKR